MQSSNKALFSLVRLGIGHRAEALTEPVNWNEVQALAEKQGLAAVLVDGIEILPVTQRPPKEDLLQLIGQVVQSYEYRYELYRRAIAELAGFYREHGLKMMVLKGYACSLDWPKPEHRPSGDIDIWLFGKQEEGDFLLETEKDIRVDKSHHHHTVFNWKGFSVENHYDFINVFHHKSNFQLESIFKNLGLNDSCSIELYNERVYLPSPNLNALFLLKHNMTDFAAFSMSLRQLLDWGFFINNNCKRIDWEWLLSIIKEYHMMDFFNTINAICVEDLGFSSAIFPYIQYHLDLKERFISDVLYPKFPREEPSFYISRLIYKFRRWLGNGWKHKICYNESMLSAFGSGIKNHLFKPSCRQE